MKRRLLFVLFAMFSMNMGGFGLVAGAQTPVASPAASPEASPVASPAAAMPELPVTVQDAVGDDVVIRDVSRIVSLNGNVTETLFAMGFGANVVAVDVSALYPEEAQALPKIGYQREISAESVLSFEPTLVIGTDDSGPPVAIDQLRAAGVTVLILPVSHSAEGAIAEIRTLGTALGVPERGNAVADSVAATIAEAQELSAGIEPKARVAFLYVRGEGTQLLAGSDSLADAVIAAAGGVNVGAEIGIHGYQPITPEALVSAAPDVILVMRLGLEMTGGMEALMQIPGVAQTPAAENNRFLVFDDLYLLGFGPRIGDAIYDLTLALYPQIEGTPKHPEWQGVASS
jgi:iron complex transport system substrate-binding protein